MSTEYITKVRNIYKDIKKYDYNPTYQLKVNTNLCTYEIYINDILVDFSFTTGRTAGEQNIDIPEYILKSGIQSVRYVVYPKAIKNGVLEKFVDHDAEFSLRIVHGEYYKTKFEDFTEDYHSTSLKINKDLPFIEIEGKFTATVPYTLEGWSKGVDLSKEDPEKLEEEVKGRMKEIADLYRNKDIEGLAREQYKRVKEIDQAFYFNTKENSAEWESELQEALNESKSVELINGKMKIMGDGKLVTVLITDGSFRNQSIIRSRVEGGYSDFYPQYFYRPRAGAKLEIIR
ncbi:hypothetical protein SD960_08105 [Flavobacterium sp. MMLR14_040]|uniref:hypothetical protein n=1 Tax=Flavobacterium sp. MMLR14_040 TaxID=3093843 RepID=UPI00298FB3F7|nr:hypothetical protein [Flavobacterium sp. MMLR14_040]MDW8850050.1 hypothetical protein [Flavobacterium sp. MMLR14_040]